MTQDEPTPNTLDGLIAEYLQSVDAGRKPDRATFLAAHPDHAAGLRSFFQDLDRMDGLDPDATIGPAPVPSPGSLVRYFGDYELIEEIARGGMGVVYRARQVSLNRFVALKMILTGQLASSEDVQRFRAEAEAAANLDHPNILPIYEIGEHEGQHYFSMKLVEGGSFAQNRQTALRERIEKLARIARAVHFAHQRGILHRDLKPANVLLDKDGTPYVTDFGLAKRTDGDSNLTQTGAIVGTPSYMAPEQARSDKQLTTGVDVYALGAMLYEVLTGRPPFKAATPVETVLQVLERDPALPSSIDLRVDRDLETIALKCLEKDPAKRYASAAELADEMERWQRGEPIVARPVSATNRALRWCRRNPIIAGSLTAVALSLMLGAIVSLIFGMQARLAANDASEQAILASNEAANALAARDAAEFEAYVANLALADIAMSAKEPVRLRARLDACPPRLRNWEWHDLNTRGDRSLLVFNGHKSSVVSAAFNLSGDRVLTASYDHTARIWDTATGNEVAVLRGHEAIINSAAFSPTGGRILTGSGSRTKGPDDYTARMWDAATGQQLVVFCGHVMGLESVAFNRSGDRIVTASWDKTARVWDATSGKQLALLEHQRPVLTATFSPSGEHVVTAVSGTTAQMWDAVSGKQLAVFRGHQGGLRMAAFDASGDRVVTASFDKTARVWDSATGKELAVLRGHEHFVMHAAFNASSDRIVTASNDKTARVWDAKNGNLLATLRGHESELLWCEFDASGRFVVTASVDRTVRVWDATSGKELTVLRGHGHTVLQAAFGPQGDRVVTVSMDKTARFWDALTPESPIRLGPKGDKLVRRFQSIGRPRGYRMLGQDGSSMDAARGNILTLLLGHGDRVMSAEFNRAGDQLVTASWDKTARVWDAATGRQLAVMRGHTDGVHAAAFNPAGDRVVTASQDKTTRIWDSITGKEMTILRDHDNAVTSVAFSPSGDRLVTGSNDQTIRIWDIAAGNVVHVLRGHKAGIRSVAFNSTGDRVVSAHRPTGL